MQVYPGNTGDPKTVPDQVETLTKRFGLSRVVLVGDRGMLTQTQIDVLKKHPGLGWISALRSGAIRRLLAEGHLIRKDLEAERLAEITSPEFPGERLVACYNPQLAEQRRQKRQELLAATQAELEALAASVARPAGPPETAAEIGVRAGKIINHYKMAKHFTLTIRDGHLGWARKEDAIQKEELLDGIYVIRTSEPAERLTAADAVRSYKRLALVEQAFRCLKGIDLLGASDPPPHGRPGAGAHPAVHAGLLRGVAPAPGVGAAAVRGRGTGRGPAAARPGARRPAPRSRRGRRRRRTRRRTACRSRAFGRCWLIWARAAATRAW